MTQGIMVYEKREMEFKMRLYFAWQRRLTEHIGFFIERKRADNGLG